MITLAAVDGRAAQKPGETFTVEATWDCLDAPRRFRLVLYWTTTGPGQAEQEELARREDDPRQESGSRQFTFTVPAGPWSFTGSLISLHWSIQLTVDDETTHYDFTVAPGPADTPLTLGPPAFTTS